MPRRPDAVAFDALGTLFSLEALRPRLEDAKLPGHMLERFMAETLRDAFALTAAGSYRPFSEVAGSVLDRLFAKSAGQADAAQKETILHGFAALHAYDDAAPAIGKLHDSGVRVVILTNGGETPTEANARRAGFREHLERIVTIDEAKRWKPSPEPYHTCASLLGIAPERLCLVAAHGWDVHGAHRAGLMTGFVGRNGMPFPAVMDPPDVSGASLAEVVDALLALTA